MLHLTGTLIKAQHLDGMTTKKGEVIPPRDVLQVMTERENGLGDLLSITVPSLAPFADRIGQPVTVPVRAWASGAAVSFFYRAE